MCRSALRAGDTARAGERTLFVCVYRARQAATLAALLAPARAAGFTIRLWALDEVHPALAADTAGSGPGGKFELINRLLEGMSDDTWLVVSDDDIEMGPGALPVAVAVAGRCGFALSQPAH